MFICAGANLREVSLKFIELVGGDLMWANLIAADFSGANLKEANLVYANLRNADLSNAELKCADFSGAILNEVNLMRADLRGANLRGANLTAANLKFANLRGADLSGANLSQANMRNCDLKNAILWTADLSHTNLSLSDLTDANLNDAFLYCSDLTDAKLLGVSFNGAKLDGVIVKGTILDPQRRKTKESKTDNHHPENNHSEPVEEVSFERKHWQFSHKTFSDHPSTANGKASNLNPKLDWTTPLRSQQSDFIQRLNSGHLLCCQIEGQHSELMVISGDKLDHLRNLCWKLTAQYSLKIVDHYGRLSRVQDVFINNIRSKLAQEVVKARLGNLVNEVSYEKLLQSMDKEGNFDFSLIAPGKVNILVKAAHGSNDAARWLISNEEIKKHKIVVFILIKEQISETQPQYNLILSGFLPAEMIQNIIHNEGSVGISQLLYAGGLPSYIDSFS